MKKQFFTLCLFAASIYSHDTQGQIITTFAGDGTAGYSGDGIAATTAEINKTYFAIKDSAGNLYIADYHNNRVRKISTDGNIWTIAGTGTAGYSGDGGPATAAELYYPDGIGIDPAGNVIFSDFRNQRVRKINVSTGVITTIAGTGVSGFSGDNGPATAAQFNFPAGLSIDHSGNIYIADQWNNRVRMINRAGIISSVAGNGPTGYLSGGYGGDDGQATSAQINFITMVSVGPNGSFYIGDQGNQRIRKVNSAGIITTYAGTGTMGYSGDGGAATAAEIDDPEGVWVDASGKVYISDAANSRVRMVDTLGIITTIAGTGTAGYSGDVGAATLAQLNYPTGLFVDNENNLYISDYDNNRLRKVALPHVSTAVVSESVIGSKWLVYPDPASDLLTIVSPELANNSICFCINNSLGGVLEKGQIRPIGDNAAIYIDKLPVGNYVLQLFNSDSGIPIYQTQFVKQ